jgi:hypothetical protein
MSKILLKLILAVSIIFSIHYASAHRVIVGRGQACGPQHELSGEVDYVCSSGDECRDGYCKTPSCLSGETVSCKEKLAAKGVDKKTVISVYKGYCYYQCPGMYEALNAGSKAEAQKICDQCKYCYPQTSDLQKAN